MVTMKSLLSGHPVPRVIDYVSLDVDGPEDKVLQGFPFNKHEVILWTIEHDSYSIGTKHKFDIKAIMEQNGYHIAVEDVPHDGHVFEDWYVNNNSKKLL